MKIAATPGHIASILQSTPAGPPASVSSQSPGLLVSADAVPTSGAERLWRRQTTSLGPSRYLVMSPHQVEAVAPGLAEVAGFVKTLAAAAIGEHHPWLKAGVDTLWFVYRGLSVANEWKERDAIHGAIVFEMLDLTAGMVADVTAVHGRWAGHDKLLEQLSVTFQTAQGCFDGTPVTSMVEALAAEDGPNALAFSALRLAGMNLFDASPQPLEAVPAAAPGLRLVPRRLT